uniref:Uncharacterized protein n=1 Tax=Physcomitrium patens TaxID=3218 RepID=A0A7I3YZJ0_PHYPA
MGVALDSQDLDLRDLPGGARSGGYRPGAPLPPDRALVAHGKLSFDHADFTESILLLMLLLLQRWVKVHTRP